MTVSVTISEKKPENSANTACRAPPTLYSINKRYNSISNYEKDLPQGIEGEECDENNGHSDESTWSHEFGLSVHREPPSQ